MQRLLVVRCPDLLDPGEQDHEARAFDQVVATVETFTPAVQRIRPGICAIATRGPSRYFGGDDALARRIQDAVLGHADDVGTGVADGLFGAVLAACAAGRHGRPVVVPPGATARFLSPWPVADLERPEFADLLIRLGIHTLGELAALPKDRVLARFGVDGAVCHRVAAGAVGELPGLRTLPDTARGDLVVARQPGFWGGTAGADGRAAAAVRDVRRLLGPDAVVVAVAQGGRGPSERIRFAPWSGATGGTDRSRDAGSERPPGSTSRSPAPAPWPGRVPPPQPVVVPTRPVPVDLVDGGGTTVDVTTRGMATAAPARLSVDGGSWTVVSGWAGPWPADERWWSTRRRRRARLQIVTAPGLAHLLVREHGRWWLEGTYD